MEILVEFRECIGAAIPQIVTLLGENEPYSRRAGADCLATLSDYGKRSGILFWRR